MYAVIQDAEFGGKNSECCHFILKLFVAGWKFMFLSNCWNKKISQGFAVPRIMLW